MQSRPQYDLPTAVTFLMAGLGIGSLLAICWLGASMASPWRNPEVARLQRNGVDRIGGSNSAGEASTHRTGRGNDECAASFTYHTSGTYQ
jgi:hypothetical protein